jgi:hypothetical protein
VPLCAKILTRRGWLAHDEVQVGDETIGYNPAIGRSEWTLITKVVRYEDGEVWRIGNRGWHADVTPNHRWWSDTETHVAPSEEICPECGWLPRGTKMPARGVQVHRNKIHEVPPGRPERRFRGEFIRTDQMHSGHRIRLAAPADTDGIPGLSLEDVRIIAWLQGDGHLEPVLAKPEICPECGWLPGTERHNRAPRQLSNSVAVHRAKRHGMGKGQTRGELAGYDGTIFQSKPAMIAKLRGLLARIEHTESVRHRGGNTQSAYVFRLRRAYVTDLIKRSGVLDMGPDAFVLALSPDQRAAWLDSMIDAEGHRMPGKMPGYSEFVRIAQVNGPLQDVIKLAVYLEGWRPTFSANAAERNGYQPAGVIGMAGPHVVPSMFLPHEELERQSVWCVKTDLETWTAEQHGQVFLTGNTIGSTFAAYAGPFWGLGIYNPLGQHLCRAELCAAQGYGTLAALNRPGGYALGTRSAAPGRRRRAATT